MINEYNQPTPAISDTFGNNTDAPPTNDEVISTLNGLIETCRDGQEGFKQAAEGVERSDLKTLFYEFGQQRATFVGELQDVVRTLGGDPETLVVLPELCIEAGSISNLSLRARTNLPFWMNANAVKIRAKAHIKSALETALPAYVAQAVQDQYTAVQSAHDRVKALRDSFKDDKTTSARIGS